MQRVNEKDYCNLQCSRSKIIFCRKLTNMVDYKAPIIFKWTDNYLIQQYLLWKLIKRTPIKYLEPIFESRMRVEIVA
jgi:hypothetical protein